MKKFYFRLLLVALLVAAAGTMCAQSTVTKKIKDNGVTMIETMNEDGTALIQRPYRWFACMGDADNESVALEMAQLEAYAAISRVLENVVSARAERGTVGVNGKVEKAIRSYWEQMSFSIQKACEPFGEAESVYDKATGMYHVTAKVGIRGDRYVKLLDGAKDAKPEGLSGDEMKKFVEINNEIIDAAKQ